jgi:FG-GAP-like repeat/FG-GAP repeat
VELPLPLGLDNGTSVRFATTDGDGDGRAELLATTVASGLDFTDALSRLRFSADGTLSSPERLQTLATNCTSTGLALADVDADGREDALVSSESGFDTNCGLHVLRGTTGSGFGTPQLLHRGNGGSVRMMRNAADGRAMLVMPLDDQRLLVLRQRATAGTWDAPAYVSTATDAGNGPWNRSVAIGDVDGDGRDDLVLLVQQRNGVPQRQVFLQRADGSLSEALRVEQTGGSQVSTLLDINGDGRVDLVMNFESHLAWLAAGIDGSFGAPQRLSDSSSSSDLVVADVDGDGRPDLLFTEHNVGLRVMYRDASGGLRPAQTVRTGSYGPTPSRLLVADFDGNGLPDVALGNRWLRQRSGIGPASDRGARPASAIGPAAGTHPRPVRLGGRFGLVLKPRPPLNQVTRREAP